MTSVALLLLALGLFAAAAWGRPSLTFGVLVGTLLLVPSTLPVPGAPPTLVTVSRLVELGALVGLVVAARRGRLPDRVLGAHPVMLPLLGYLAVIAVTGLALADAGLDHVAGMYLWLSQAETLLFLLLGLALARTLAARTVLVTLAVVAAVAASVVLLEVGTGGSWAQRLFRLGAPDLLGTVPAAPLEVRSGQPRGRAAGDFALQTGWVLVALLPATLGAAALRLRAGARASGALLLLVALPLLLVGVVLTRSRSPLLVVLLLTVLVGLGLLTTLQRARLPALLGATAVAAVAGLALLPLLAARLSPSVDQGSIDVRLERLPRVLDLPAESPLQGVGLGGIARVDLPGLDTSYVLTYVETGAIAAAALLVAVLFAVGSVLRGLWPQLRPTGAPDSVLVLATGLGAAALAASALTMDTFQAQTSSRLTWLLVGIGLAAAERLRGPQRLPGSRHAPERAFLVLAALLGGLALHALTPQHAAARYVFATVGVDIDVAGVSPGSFGRTYVVSACELARETSVGQEWKVTSCGEQGPPGWGTLRIEGPDAAAVEAAATSVFAAVRDLRQLERLRVGPPADGVVVGRPTAARVAPVVLPVLAAGAALLLPFTAPRRPAGGGRGGRPAGRSPWRSRP